MRVLRLTLVTLSLLSAGLALAAEEELIWQNGQWIRQAPAAEGTAEGELALIRRYMDAKDYGAAVAQAKKFQKRYPSDPLREQVFGLAGDAELARKRYWQAYQWYEKQLNEFPSGERLERGISREMEVAEAFLAGKKRVVWGFIPLPAKSEGIAILEKVSERSPGSVQAEMAMMRVADYRFAEKEWDGAVSSYDEFVKAFPRSPRAGYAEARAAEAMWRSYHGPLYDATPLLEAQQRYRNLLAERPAMARDVGAEGILEQMDVARARKDYEIARYYQRVKRPSAAAYYYILVVRDYGQTRWGQQSRSELNRLPAAARAEAEGLLDTQDANP